MKRLCVYVRVCASVCGCVCVCECVVYVYFALIRTKSVKNMAIFPYPDHVKNAYGNQFFIGVNNLIGETCLV